MQIIRNYFSFLGIILLLAMPSFLHGQKVYSVQYKSEADVKVFVVEYKSEADLIVYKCEYKSEAVENRGLWCFVDYKSEADKLIYFVEYNSEADLKIYFTEYKSEAFWKDRSKIHLMY